MISSRAEIMDSFGRLKAYCEKEEFKGWDPFDGLNSTLFSRVPFLAGNKIARLLWIQLFKRSPVNFRKVARVEKGWNPKGLGLFLHGYCNLYRTDPDPEILEIIHFLSRTLIKVQSPGYSGSCWGYNFDWQARAFYQPKYTPTVVATCFVAMAFIEAYEVTGTQVYLETAISSSQFVLKDLNRTYNDNGDFCFSYSPEDTSQVYNASLLGSKLLGRIYKYTGDKQLLRAGVSAIRFVCAAQNTDGSWPYGTRRFHQWIDNFHTGFNLEALAAFQADTDTFEFDEHIKLGIQYYLDTFFTPEGIPKYYHNQLYPVDVHATAQLVLTLSTSGMFIAQQPLIDKVLRWTIVNMQDKDGYFYYQFRKRINSKIPYMRWAQSWMFYAFTEYLLCTDTDGTACNGSVHRKSSRKSNRVNSKRDNKQG